MKTSRILTLLLAGMFGLTGPTAWANLRAPRRADGYLSGGLRIILPPGAVRLAREDMRIVFPAFNSGTPFRDAAVSFEIVYEFENATEKILRFPVRFVAVDIRGLEARLNAAEIIPVLGADAAEESECLSRLADHRRAFLEPLYRPFLQTLKPDAPAEAKFASIFGPFPVGDGTKPEFRTAGLTIALRPGRNTLVLRYRQRPFVAEYGHGYTAAWPARGFTGFDYLLYPAMSWEAGRDFRFSLNVEIPYYEGKFIFFPRWEEPRTKSNVDLREVKSVRPHVRLLSAEFDRWPAAVLTVLVWFDKKALSRLPE